MTIIQSLGRTAAAGIVHHRARLAHGALVRWMGRIIAAASLGGATLSEFHIVSSGLRLGLPSGAARAGSFGKLVGRPTVVWPQVGSLGSGSLAGSQSGSAASSRFPATALRYVLAALIGAGTIRM